MPVSTAVLSERSGKGRTVSIRVEEQADVAAFRQKMELPESRAIYRRRGEVAECPAKRGNS